MGVRVAFALGALLITLGTGLVSVAGALIVAGLMVLAYAALFLIEIGAP